MDYHLCSTLPIAVQRSISNDSLHVSRNAGHFSNHRGFFLKKYGVAIGVFFAKAICLAVMLPCLIPFSDPDHKKYIETDF